MRSSLALQVLRAHAAKSSRHDTPVDHDSCCIRQLDSTLRAPTEVRTHIIYYYSGFQTLQCISTCAREKVRENVTSLGVPKRGQLTLQLNVILRNNSSHGCLESSHHCLRAHIHSTIWTADIRIHSYSLEVRQLA